MLEVGFTLFFLTVAFLIWLKAIVLFVYLVSLINWYWLCAVALVMTVLAVFRSSGA